MKATTNVEKISIQNHLKNLFMKTLRNSNVKHVAKVLLQILFIRLMSKDMNYLKQKTLKTIPKMYQNPLKIDVPHEIQLKKISIIIFR